jgi:hypothetical protein
MFFACCGRLAGVSENELLVDFWSHRDPTHRDENTETARIVLGAVVRVIPLQRCRPVAVEVAV